MNALVLFRSQQNYLNTIANKAMLRHEMQQPRFFFLGFYCTTLKTYTYIYNNNKVNVHYLGKNRRKASKEGGNT
jgi:hypothetical protein